MSSLQMMASRVCIASTLAGWFQGSLDANGILVHALKIIKSSTRKEKRERNRVRKRRDSDKRRLGSGTTRVHCPSVSHQAPTTTPVWTKQYVYTIDFATEM